MPKSTLMSSASVQVPSTICGSTDGSRRSRSATARGAPRVRARHRKQPMAYLMGGVLLGDVVRDTLERHNAAGAQTERRGGAGPVGGSRGRKDPTGRFYQRFDQSSFRTSTIRTCIGE